MRCPQCQTESRPPDEFCARCGHRLFAWLGDPLGAIEAAGPAAAAPGAPLARSSSTAKVAAALVAIVALALLSPVWAALLFVTVGVVLWRWPRIGWGAYGALLISVIIAALLWALASAGRSAPARAQPALRAATTLAQGTSPRLARLASTDTHRDNVRAHAPLVAGGPGAAAERRRLEKGGRHALPPLRLPESV